jgi:hypothetical protein
VVSKDQPCIAAQQLTQLQLKVDQTQVKIRAARETAVGQSKVFEEELKDQLNQLKTVKEYKNRLTIVSPIDGRLVAPGIETMAGQWISPGEQKPLAMVVDNDMLIAYAVVNQGDVQLLTNAKDTDANGVGYKTSVRFAGDIATTLEPIETRLGSAAVSNVSILPIVPQHRMSCPLTPQLRTARRPASISARVSLSSTMSRVPSRPRAIPGAPWHHAMANRLPSSTPPPRRSGQLSDSTSNTARS